MRVFCIERLTLLWEQELYNQFEYKNPRPYFHTFEGDVSHVATVIHLLVVEFI